MKNNSSIFVIVISLFIIIFIIISYFILSDSLVKYSNNSNLGISRCNSNNSNNANNNSDTCNASVNSSGGDEVFHIRDNIYMYEDAKAICKAYGARLAKLNEVIDAYKKGGNWCSYGWSEGQMALYPTQKDFWEKLQTDNKTKNQCGVPGVNGGYFDNEYYKFGANCYGKKPDASCNELAEQDFERKKLTSVDFKAAKYKHEIEGNQIKVAPFNEGSWSQ